MVNGMISFSCEASGDPTPTIMWYRNQSLISGNEEKTFVEVYVLLA